MRALILALCLCALVPSALAQKPSATPDPLTVTLPSGKTLRFETTEQKAKFEAGRARARETGLQDEQRQREQQAAEDAKRFENYEVRRLLLSKMTHLWLYIYSFEGPWTHGRASVAVRTSPDSDTFEEGRSIEGGVYVEWTAPKDIVNGATRVVPAWECGVMEVGGSRYKRFTTDAKRAYQYLTAPETVEWPAVGR